VDLGGWVRPQNSMSYQKNAGMFWQVKNYLTYSNNIGKHNFSAMLGQEAWESRWDYFRGSSTDLPSDEVHNVKLGKSTSYNIGQGFGSSAMASFFTRETYNYDDRYLATYTYRYDGSSNFGPDNRWAGFHSLAVAWRFSNEKFWNKSFINNGKLRIGWGQTGNANIGSYAWGSSISNMPSALGQGFRPANIPNTGIRWESQEQYNLGLDLSMFDNRINLTVDAYYKVSDDMLMSLDLPSYMGTDGNVSLALAAPKGNYGSIENKGLEITLDTHPIDRENFAWDSNFQISFNRNKLLAIKGAEATTLPGYGQWSDIVCMSEVGKPLYNFYGYIVEGVYVDLADIENSPRAEKYPVDGVFNRTNTVWVGDIKYKDIAGAFDENGNPIPDGKITEADRTDIGSPLPKFTYGWTNTFRYKNFDLNIFINGSYGNKVLNYNSMSLSHMNSLWRNQLSIVKDRAQIVPTNGVYTKDWYNNINNLTIANPDTKIPRPTLNDPNDNDRMSTRYIEDGSYLRIKNITLGYTLPKRLLEKIKVDRLKVYCNIQNVYTFTKYTGYDPEVGASTQDYSGLAYGVDNGRYPSPMLCSFGVNLTF
jgi:TonB-linked SusC/RagA family outer membrane protein